MHASEASPIARASTPSPPDSSSSLADASGPLPSGSSTPTNPSPPLAAASEPSSGLDELDLFGELERGESALSQDLASATARPAEEPRFAGSSESAKLSGLDEQDLFGDLDSPDEGAASSTDAREGDAPGRVAGEGVASSRATPDPDPDLFAGLPSLEDPPDDGIDVPIGVDVEEPTRVPARARSTGERAAPARNVAPQPRVAATAATPSAPDTTQARPSQIWRVVVAVLALAAFGLAAFALLAPETVQVPAGTSRLVVTTEPPGGAVRVDEGALVGAPATFDGLTPGEHVVVVEDDGVVRWQGSVDLASGASRTLRVVLE